MITNFDRETQCAKCGETYLPEDANDPHFGCEDLMILLDSHTAQRHLASEVRLSEARGIPSGTTRCGMKITQRFWPNVAGPADCTACRMTVVP